MKTNFLKDVDKGLSAPIKYIPSKYFYDAKGGELFRKIMALPEYYLTKAEHEIFLLQTLALIKALNIDRNIDFDLIELGAGDGTKTIHLLKALNKSEFKVTYTPIDISTNVLKKLETFVLNEIPDFKINTKQGEYFEVLKVLKTYTKPKIILFLGSNIGNLKDDMAAIFMKKLSAVLNPNDKVVLGVDLIKPKNIVLPAYNDAQGVTKQFNLNLLERINREFGANFEIDAFAHTPEYSDTEGIARSFLTSTKPQTVTVSALDKSFSFKKDERIHTEISRKYDDNVLNDILKNTNLEIIEKLTDSNHYFADYILNRTSSK